MREREPGNQYKVLFKAAAERLRDAELMRTFLDRIVRWMECRALMGPICVNVEERIRAAGDEPWVDEGGISGVILLSTSHVALHTWPLGEKAVLDAYSCRPYDLDILRDALRLHYDPHTMTIYDLSNALEWDACNTGVTNEALDGEGT